MKNGTTARALESPAFFLGLGFPCRSGSWKLPVPSTNWWPQQPETALSQGLKVRGEVASEMGGTCWFPVYPFIEVTEEVILEKWERKPRKKKPWVPRRMKDLAGLGPFKNLGTYGVSSWWQPLLLLGLNSEVGNSTCGSLLPNPGKENHHQVSLSDRTWRGSSQSPR